MNDLFGISMTYVMIALLVILAIAASAVGWVVLRDRVMFVIGLRNIPRRPAQTVLIILGLMLSTLIISTAFSIGDTVDYSITNLVYQRLQNIDEVVHTRTGEKSNGGDAALVTTKPIPADRAAALVADIKAIPGVDGALSVLRTTVPVLDARTRLNEPRAGLVGAAPDQMGGFESDLATRDGRSVTLSGLAPGELYVNASLADKLDIATGDPLQLYVNGQAHPFVVRDIVRDRVLSGALLDNARGVVMALPDAQALLGRQDVDLIVVSNTGGVRGGIDSSASIRDAINRLLAGTSWSADATKADLVDQAGTAASFLTTFFVVLGLFSIAAGMLLIFLIFVMLSAERKVEMGMVRAVGTKRRHLVEMFISEGMAYNTVAAAIGCALGVVVSIAMVRVMAALFSAASLTVAFHVTARSLIVSYSLGVVLTFLTVTFSSWRVGSLNIVSAIRDAPDPPARHELAPRGRGLGGLLIFATWTVFKPARLRDWGAAIGLVALAPLAVGLTGALAAGAFALYGSGVAGGVVAILLGALAVCAAIGSVVMVGLGLNRLFQTGALALVVGAVLLIVGLITWRAVAYTGGISLLILGSALTLVMLRLPARPVFTAMGLSMLVFWLLGAGNHIPPRSMDGGVEMFFLSGITMVLSSTFVLVYNADLMLGVLTRVGGVWSSLVPSIRTAVAYPLANKFRTGMTIAMISLVMFALVMISTMNYNFSQIFLSKDALGGYDIIVTENANNPIGDLKTALERAGGETAGVQEVDPVRIANPITSEARMSPPPGGQGGAFGRYMIVGPSDAFIQHNGVTFHARARGLPDDAAVWRELLTNPNAAVIDAFAIGGGFGGGGGFRLSGVKADETSFEPPHVQVRDAAEPGNIRDVQIIGIFTTRASGIYQGLYLSPQAFASVFPRPETTALLVKMAPGTDAARRAKEIEAALSPYGVQADSLRKLIDEQQAQNRGFLYLIEGFMGIGLFVGIAAVGVVAFRTVVERRQQIGMLRALGYTRRQIAISFIMESSFVALLGVLSGIGLALLLAYQLLQGDAFAAGSVERFSIPWLQIGLIGLFAFLAALIMTIIPSRQAASIPIAQALRYE